MAVAPDISVWLQRIEAARLPARRASPDLLGQLRQSLKRPVDRIVCIAVDVDPTVDLLRQTLRAHADDVAAGLRLLQTLLGAPTTLIDERAATRFDSRYPNLDPPLLVPRLLKRRLPTSAPPTDAGIVLLDAITAWQIGRISRDEPAGALPVVIDDVATRHRLRTSAAVSTRVADLLSSAGVDCVQRRLYHGPLMQERGIDLDTTIGQTELWLHVIPTAVRDAPRGCTRCGECVVACPARIHPAALLEASQERDTIMGHRFGLSACIECGLCTHVCPSRLPVLEAIRQLKRLPA